MKRYLSSFVSQVNHLERLIDSIQKKRKFKNISLRSKINYGKIAPQKLHRRCRNAKQQIIPTGKRNIAQQIPKVVKSVSNVPV